jgi:hypothetical protein
VKSYRAPAGWIVKYYMAIGIYLLMVAGMIAAGIRYFMYPPISTSGTLLEKIMLALLGGFYMVVIGRQISLLVNQSYRVLIDDAGIRSVHAFRTSRFQAIQRIERQRPYPRSPRKPAERLQLTTPAGVHTLVLDVAQVDAFLGDVRRVNPDVEIVGFDTVFNAPPHAGELPWQVEIIRRYPIFMTVASGIMALLFLPFSLGAAAQSVMSLITLTHQWQWGTLLIAVGCLVPASGVVVLTRDFLRMREVPREMQLTNDAVGMRTGKGRVTIPLTAIRAITAQRMGSQLWIAVAHDCNGRVGRFMFPTLILPDATTFIATLHTLNPAITLDGFHGTP